MRGFHPNLEYLEEVATSAGRIALKHRVVDQTFHLKADGSKICDADEAVNNYVIERFAADHPHISVIGEEGTNVIPDAEYVVLFDPIDGTAAFLKGQSGFSFCVSILLDGRPILAVIHDPILGIAWLAERGHQTTMRSAYGIKAVCVSDKLEISGADINLFWWSGAGYQLDRVAAELEKQSARCHRPASSAMSGGRVASGSIDGSIFPSHNPWESAAASLVVEGAGGRASDLFGNALVFEVGKMNGHVISNGRLHDQLLQTVNACQW